ncbi:hypothetical protein V8F20_001354 [Naviculisporaceae sp. PSN 640]
MASYIVLISLALASSATALMPRGDIGTVCKTPKGSGICGSTVKADCNGYYMPGYCPGDNTIQCCIKATNHACSTPDGNGLCARTEKNDCNGFYTAGYCPGDKHFQCCVPSPDPPAEDPEGDDSTEEEVSSADTEAADLHEPLDIDLDATIAANNTIIGDDIEPEDEEDPLVARAAKKLTRGDLIVKAAEKWLGKKYVFGGGDCSGPTKGGFDCSGLVLHAVCKVTKKKLPHKAQAQYNLKKGKHVKLSQIRPGDALFWAKDKKCSSKTHHVGIYVGKDKKGKRIVLHAPHTGSVVKKAKVWTSGLCGSAVRFW